MRVFSADHEMWAEHSRSNLVFTIFGRRDQAYPTPHETYFYIKVKANQYLVGLYNF